jgi:hypothetical protein
MVGNPQSLALGVLEAEDGDGLEAPDDGALGGLAGGGSSSWTLRAIGPRM